MSITEDRSATSGGAGKGESLPVIKSDTPKLDMKGMAFRIWHFLTALCNFDIGRTEVPICLDTGCSMSLVDRRFLKSHVPGIIIQKQSLTVNLRGIGSNRHSTDEYVNITFFMKAITPESKWVYLKFIKEFHVVDNLKANMLVGMDILGSKKAVIDISANRIIFGSCQKAAVEAHATARDNLRVRRAVRVEKSQIIPPKSIANVPIYMKAKSAIPDRDFLFEPTVAGAYAHFVDAGFNYIQIRNDIDKPIQLKKE